MDKLRIAEKNKTNLELKSLFSFIKRNKETIDRLKSQEASTFNKNQISKLTEKNSEYEKQIEILEEKIEKIDKGDLDIEINNQNTNNVSNSLKQKEISDKKNKDKVDKINFEKNKVKTFVENERSSKKSELNEYNINKEADRFFKNISSIPDYMNSNLKEMTNNKGYIWKGIWCFGEIDIKNKNPLIIFEKIKGGNLIINEISDTHITKFEKQAKNNKKLVSKQTRTYL